MKELMGDSDEEDDDDDEEEDDDDTEEESGSAEEWKADLTDVLSIKVKDGGWDCESIISTYSNTENHPSLIAIPRSEGTFFILFLLLSQKSLRNFA